MSSKPIEHGKVKDRRYWRFKAEDLLKKKTTFTSKQVSLIISEMLKTLQYETERVAPLKSLQALARGCDYLLSDMDKRSDSEKPMKVLNRMLEMVKGLQYFREAVDTVNDFDKRHGG